MHKPVLLKEVLEGLGIEAGDTVLDGTFGGGGHSSEVLRRFGDRVRVIGLDEDSEAVKQGQKLGIDVRRGNFRNLDKALSELGIEKVDAILLDLGISSDQIDESGRGFSFQRDEPLDMRMSTEGPTAADIVNTFSEEALELILRGFGEEGHSRQIARAIVDGREVKPFSTTGELVRVIEGVRPRTWRDKIHPATKTFQALRIAVNEELTALEEGLDKGFEALSVGGRFAIISFHSLEDRLVKNFFRDRAKEGRAELITKKPVVASTEEREANPRSRSAKLRIIEKL